MVLAHCSGSVPIDETAPFFTGVPSGGNCRHLMNPYPEKVSEDYVEKEKQPHERPEYWQA
jgi:hypothetical protein